MTKFRKIVLIFVRWRERRAWAATKRWQRAAWRLYGYPKGAIRDGYAGTFDEPPPRAADRALDALAAKLDEIEGRGDARPSGHGGNKKPEGTYFLHPGWRDAEVKASTMPHGPMVDNIRKAGGA